MPRPPLKRHSVTQPLTESYRFIPLTQEQNAIVDAEDFDWLSQWNWCAEWHPRTRSFYAARRGDKGKCMIWMHRFILGIQSGYVDHKNRNSLDNRRNNLRECSVSQNGCNRGPQRDNKAGYKGVSFDKRKHKWRATINVQRKQIFLGYFSDSKMAAHAYNEAAKELFGEFAYLNHLP